jgi:hypothetical protein
MNILIDLTTAGLDTGPFDLYSNVDSYTTAFETDVSRQELLSGYITPLAPVGTTFIRVKSTGACTNYINLEIDPTTTTTSTSTSSTTSTSTSTTTSTTTAAPVNYKYYFELIDGGNGTVTLNSAGGFASFTTNYNLILVNTPTYNLSGSGIVSTPGKKIQKIEKLAYNGTTVLYSATIDSPNYTFGSGLFNMTSTGTDPGEFQTIRITFVNA